MVFGYATKKTENYMPLALDISYKILIELVALFSALLKKLFFHRLKEFFFTERFLY